MPRVCFCCPANLSSWQGRVFLPTNRSFTAGACQLSVGYGYNNANQLTEGVVFRHPKSFLEPSHFFLDIEIIVAQMDLHSTAAEGAQRSLLADRAKILVDLPVVQRRLQDDEGEDEPVVVA
jgi:hypothetical protein